MDLHQFKWAKDVDDLPPEWNHLVGEYEPRSDAKLVHYTLGSPCFKEYQNCEFSNEWFAEFALATI
jgi:NADPH-dependent glutamate synthase beta subunit-like oxidoreductase